ncbi:phosphatase PAP2 family protein [Streptomyces rimosus]|uniref:phosphatase PAP2 family protein n=1 Tax=Streptomyces rimosus TaxID=1927 RepID=UPI00099CD5EE|nr:phosphatase PAP2 family protein [Streptomyces rimosus]
MDHRLLVALRACGSDARTAAVARALPHGGEHGALWLAAGPAGAAADRSRRPARLRGTALSCGAHLLSVALKRVVRRRRPLLPGHAPLVRTTSPHSFPSAHAASATAAAVTLGALRPVGTGLSAPAAAMGLSRLVAGVHCPSDVAAGAVVGVLVAGLGDVRRAGAVMAGLGDVRGTEAYAGGARFQGVRGERT